jgi:hypothetical protein
MEYWLRDFGLTCPTNPPPLTCPGQPQPQWNSDGEGNCWLNSCTSPAPFVSANQLQATTLTGMAGDLDTVVLTTADHAGAMKVDSMLNLAQHWTTAEFNIFGDGDGFSASFSPGSTLVVRTSVDGSANDGVIPACVRETFTAETNNLALVGTSVPPLTFPSIVFTESNAAGGTPASCTNCTGEPLPGKNSCVHGGHGLSCGHPGEPPCHNP